MAVAFAVSIAAIKFLMNYIKKHDFTAFGWYRIGLGVVVLIWYILEQINNDIGYRMNAFSSNTACHGCSSCAFLRRKRMVTKRKRGLLRRLAGYGLLVLAVTGAAGAASPSGQKQARAAQETAAPTRPPTEMAVSVRPAEPMQETESVETEQPATETTLPAPLPEGYREEYVLPPLSDGTLVLVNRDFGFDPDGVETVSINDLRSIHYGVRSTELGLRPEVTEALERVARRFL